MASWCQNNDWERGEPAQWSSDSSHSRGCSEFPYGHSKVWLQISRNSLENKQTNKQNKNFKLSVVYFSSAVARTPAAG